MMHYNRLTPFPPIPAASTTPTPSTSATATTVQISTTVVAVVCYDSSCRWAIEHIKYSIKKLKNIKEPY